MGKIDRMHGRSQIGNSGGTAQEYRAPRRPQLRAPPQPPRQPKAVYEPAEPLSASTDIQPTTQEDRHGIFGAGPCPPPPQRPPYGAPASRTGPKPESCIGLGALCAPEHWHEDLNDFPGGTE